MSLVSVAATAEEGKDRRRMMTGDRRNRGTVANADPSPADVEELLRAAQDDLLLKLSVDVHTTTTSSSSFLDPDLSSRFDALRSHRAPPPPKREPPSDGPSNLPGGGGGDGGATAAGASAAVEGTRGGRSEKDGASMILGDDLAARFAALKGSSSSYLPAGSIARKPERIPKEVDDDSDESDGGDDGVSKEVEKLMQWAMDAARLDPDPSNSDDEEGIGKREEKGSDEDGDDEDDAAAKAQEEEEEEKKKPEKKRQTEGKKPPGRKWFLF